LDFHAAPWNATERRNQRLLARRLPEPEPSTEGCIRPLLPVKLLRVLPTGSNFQEEINSIMRATQRGSQTLDGAEIILFTENLFFYYLVKTSIFSKERLIF
jgi:hypothetical protein